MFEVGDEVVLSMCNLSVNQHLPSKLRRCSLPSRQGDFSNGARIGSVPSLADPSCLSCLKREEVPPLRGVRKGGETPSPIVVDGEEEY